MEEKYICEILLYRISEDEFYQKSEHDLKKEYEKMNVVDTLPPDIKFLFEKNYFQNYGGPWSYNQVYGALKIYVFGIQIRAELWLSINERFTRKSKNKGISLLGEAFQIGIFPNYSNKIIIETIDKEIERTVKNLDRIVPDLECYNNLKYLIDWKSIVFDKA